MSFRSPLRQNSEKRSKLIFVVGVAVEQRTERGGRLNVATVCKCFLSHRWNFASSVVNSLRSATSCGELYGFFKFYVKSSSVLLYAILFFSPLFYEFLKKSCLWGLHSVWDAMWNTKSAPFPARPWAKRTNYTEFKAVRLPDGRRRKKCSAICPLAGAN